MENISILKNWYLVTVDMNFYEALKELAHTILISYDMLKNPNIQLPNDQHGPAIFLVGEVYNKTGFVGGKQIVTSTIKEINNNIAIAYSGSKYELGEMYPHYKAFCNHIAQNKPVLYNFCIGKIRAFSHKDYNIFIPISIENHHYMKTFENNKENCFLYDETFGDIKDIIGTTSDGKKEYIPIMIRWIEKQKQNTFLTPDK